MKPFVRRLLVGAALLTLALSAQSQQQISDLDQLLESVRAQQQQQRALNEQREREFLSDKKKQQALLAEARRDFERRKRENQPLVAVTDANQAEINRLQKDLQTVVEDMGDLSSTFREFAGDFSAVLQESMVSAQFPQRSERLQVLAATDTQVSIDEIEALWLLLQQEMTVAGKIEVFEAPVISNQGATQQRSVLRIGVFSAFADSDFLRYVPETGELLSISRQPSWRFRNAARDFAQGGGELAAITVDPTRGSLLGMLSYTPDLRERIEQGGTIGLIIIVLGSFGVLLTLWRVLYLAVISRRIKGQLADIAAPDSGNPLGRVLLAAGGMSLQEEELLQLRLDEAVLSEIPALERGNSLIKLLAATSPLLGLLGTVTGMILTFQAISLFGTGDPKLMAGGISQALITTVLGLVAAIPLLFGHSVVAYLSRSMVQQLDEQSAGILARTAQGRGE